MCGIYGFTLNLPNQEERLNQMGQQLFHRGPDGSGSYFDERIALGMRRLSILDITNGNQPFFSPDKNIVVFCNGEIYNYQSLKNELRHKGYTFKTTNDVEVIPSLYQEYGLEFVEKLNGMYAIVLYDKTANQLILVRDRLGIKPLYYTIFQNEIIFASELKPILDFEQIPQEVNYEALSTYLDINYIPRPLTPFKNIYKLESGAIAIWKNHELTIQKHWDIAVNNQEKSEKQFFNEFEELLAESAKMQLVSDVPIGAFLSGGIDSSLVTALSASQTDKPFSVFHMQWKNVEGKIDESIYAKQVAEQYQTKQFFSVVEDIDYPKLLPFLIYHLEEPFGDAAYIPTYFLSKIARKDVTVMLSGAGGDELFGGYHHHKSHSIVKSIGGKILLNKAPAFSYFDIWKTMFEPRWKKTFDWYTPNFFKERFEEKFNQNKHSDRLNAIMLNDIEYYLQDDILFLTDKMTMATSIEARVPLLDHRLVELSVQMPSQFKVKAGEKKYLLKKIAEKYMPREVIYRQKEGFGFPVWKIINEYKEFYFNVLLRDGFLVKNGLINPKQLNKLFLKPQIQPAESWFYWQILTLEIWFQLFVGKKSHTNLFNI